MIVHANWTLCLDFGTAYSKAAAAPSEAWSRFEPASVRPLRLNPGDEAGNAFLLDSAVFVDDERVLLGRAAVEREQTLAQRKRMALRSFKTLLSVSDLDRALNTSAPVAVDPHRVFTMRDLIVLYLAYLLACVAGAQASDPVLSRARILERRYAAPAWRSGDSAGMHGAVMLLFGEAESLREELGDQLLSPGGVSIDRLSRVLPKVIGSSEPCDMGLVFEATAAAAYTSIGMANSASHLIVVDMGAGTTDFAAVARIGDQMEELEDARVTLKQAGDFIDRTLANLILDSARWARTPAQQAQLWRLLMVRMRDIKDSVFADGRAVVRHEARTLTVTQRDLERDKGFRDFKKALANAFDHAVEVVRLSAASLRRKDAQAVAVGGGAGAPFIQDLIRRGLVNRKFRVQPRPAIPDWAHAPEFGGNLAPVFPQLAIAIGGAIAPETVMATSPELNPAAGGRTGIRAERD